MKNRHLYYTRKPLKLQYFSEFVSKYALVYPEHLIPLILIQCQRDYFCIYRPIKRQNIGLQRQKCLTWRKKLNIRRQKAGWGLSLSGLFSFIPGNFFCKNPTFFLKTLPIVDVYCNRPQQPSYRPQQKNQRHYWQIGRMNAQQ